MMNEALIDYNTKASGKQQLDVVFFNSVIDKVIKINRSLKTLGGHTILVALEGSGSFELVKVAVKMSDMEDFVLYEKDSELDEDWRLMLKDILTKVVSNPKTRHVLHVEERDLSTKDLLEALDAIAAHNELFQFYQKEELESMVSVLRQVHGSLLVNDKTNAQMIDQMRTMICEDLTILIQLSPRSKILLSQMRDTLHLVNSSTIIQFGDWSRAGFEYMARKYFSSKFVVNELPKNILDEDDTTDIQLSQDAKSEEEFEVEHLEKVVLCMIDMH